MIITTKNMILKDKLCSQITWALRRKAGRGWKAIKWSGRCKTHHYSSSRLLATILEIVTDVHGKSRSLPLIRSVHVWVLECWQDGAVWLSFNDAISLILLTCAQLLIFPLLTPLCLKREGINGVRKSTGIWTLSFFQTRMHETSGSSCNIYASACASNC